MIMWRQILEMVYFTCHKNEHIKKEKPVVTERYFFLLTFVFNIRGLER